MDDKLKWIWLAILPVLTFLAGVAGAEAIGFDWVMLESAIFSALEGIGLVLLLFSGSAAALEIARYYRAQNRALQQDKTPPPALDMGQADLHRIARQEVLAALETSRLDSDEHALPVQSAQEHGSSAKGVRS